MVKSGNIFVAFLGLLRVKHTKSYSERFFNEHPHKYNLYGLSKMLSDYGIENGTTHIKDKKNDIKEIQTPFIAHYGRDFAVVNEVTPEHVSFLWKGLKHSMPVAKFVTAWSGIALLAESSPSSIEPDYKKHRKSALLQFLIKILLFCAGGFILLATYWKTSIYLNFGVSILLLLNLAGIFISWLLMLKHLHIQSRYADKICSLFKQSNCNSVLESSAAKLFGIIGWSEVGLGYFITNVVVLLFSPILVTYIALINIVTLPFSFWSVWYQYAKAKQWCPLCLTVQVLLWSIFAVNCIMNLIRIPELNFESLLTLTMLGCGYVVAVLSLTVLLPLVNTDQTVQNLRQSINSMKADKDVFTTLLKKQPFYEANDCDSIIRFGNPDSKLHLTVLTNPYCSPCAKMHKRIEELLKQANDKVSVEYILSSFGENLNSTNKHLIAACLMDHTNSAKILREWFEKGKEQRDDYFKNLSLDMANPKIEIEFQKHKIWREKSQLQGTPTVLVNGFHLPESYKVEDLIYFTDLDI